MSTSRFIKCVTVGDGAVGMLISYTSNTFPTILGMVSSFFIDHLGAVPITTSQGDELKKMIGSPAYIECSSKTQQNVKAVFDAAIKVVLHLPKQQKKKKKGQACFILGSTEDTVRIRFTKRVKNDIIGALM